MPGPWPRCAAGSAATRRGAALSTIPVDHSGKRRTCSSRIPDSPARTHGRAASPAGRSSTEMVIQGPDSDVSLLGHRLETHGPEAARRCDRSGSIKDLRRCPRYRPRNLTPRGTVCQLTLRLHFGDRPFDEEVGGRHPPSGKTMSLQTVGHACSRKRNCKSRECGNGSSTRVLVTQP